jgi:MHS family proline/betaine transporter-like MFS transporter
MKSQKRSLPFFVFLAASLEYYDFLLFPLLSSVLIHVFFQNFTQKALLTFVFFTLGSVFKFLGGVSLGILSDRFGRKYCLNVVTSLMILATVGMALFPTGLNPYVSLILLALLRSVQAFSFGAEIPSATTYAFELEPSQKIKKISFVFLGATLGAILATSLLSFMTQKFSSQYLYSFGWRLPFILGSLIGCYALWTRKFLLETLEKIPSNFKDVFKRSRPNLKELTLSTATLLLPATLISVNLYFPQFFSQMYSVKLSAIYQAQTTSLVASGLFLALLALYDHFNRSKGLAIYRLSLIACAFFVLIFRSYAAYQLTLFLILWQFFIAISMVFGMKQALELFKTQVRSTASGFVYNLAFVIATSIPPLFIKLYGIFPNPELLFLIIATAALTSFLSSYSLKKT